jgi:hypothetical protein
MLLKYHNISVNHYNHHNTYNYYEVVKIFLILKFFKFSRHYDVEFCYSVAYCRWCFIFWRSLLYYMLLELFTCTVISFQFLCVSSCFPQYDAVIEFFFSVECAVYFLSRGRLFLRRICSWFHCDILNETA